jgi:hypothetical protein
VSNCVAATIPDELPKLRAKAVHLEWEIAQLKPAEDWLLADADMPRLAQLAGMLSDCKKAIAELTVVKLNVES